MKQELVFEAPRRALPPRHLADLDAEGRAAAVAELGPAGVSGQAAGPAVLRPAARRPAADDRPARRGARHGRRRAVPAAAHRWPARSTATPGETRKTLWRAHDGTTFESVLMRYPQPQHRVHLVAGRLRHGVPVLRDRPGRADPQPVAPPRSSSRCGPRRSTLRDEFGGPALQRRVHGHGRAAGQLRAGAGRGAAHHRRAAGRASGSRRGR